MKAALYGVLTIVAALAPTAARGGEAEADRKAFVVHEWGVYVRTKAVVKYTNRWRRPAEKPPAPRDVLTAPAELVAGLPAFVLRHEKEFRPEKLHRAWLKPVLHLYGKEGLEVSVRVLTPKGRPLVYWPKPELVTETFWWMGSGVKDAVGMKWKGRLTSRRPAGVRDVEKSHWWRGLREVPGSWVRTEAGSERFIFYEATAVQEPPLRCRVEATAITLKNSQAGASGQVIVIVNDGATRSFAVVKDVAPGKAVMLSRKDGLSADADGEKLLAACRAQWRSFGMTEKEATAIVRAWKPDLLGKAGFLVISRVPPRVYGKIFPLEIKPPPDELVRTGLVFDTLPGEEGRLAWLPGLQGAMKKWTRDLASEDFKVRRAARGRFAALGDLAAPFLKKLTRSSDAEVRAAAEALLKGLITAVLELPGHGKGSRPVHVKRR